MHFSTNCAYFLVFALLANFAAAEDSNSTEQLLSVNETDATDGKVTVEEQYDEDNVTLPTSKAQSNPTGSTVIPTSPDVRTTTPKHGNPRAPSFAGWSFFIGIVVAFLLIGLAVFLFKHFCQRRSTGNNVPYTAYQ